MRLKSLLSAGFTGGHHGWIQGRPGFRHSASAASLVVVNEILSAILDVVEGVDPVLRTLLAGFAILLETSILIGLIVPGDTIVIVAATGAVGIVEFIALFVAVVIGALCGESIGFALGRFFGPRIRASRLGARIGEKTWSRAERYLDRRGGIAVFISRFLPVLHSVVPLTVGMSTMPYSRFMKWTVPASLIWALAYISVGSLAAGTYRELSDQLHYAGYIFVGIIAAFVIVVVIGKKVLSRIESRHMERSADEEPVARAGTPPATDGQPAGNQPTMPFAASHKRARRSGDGVS
jgi:membrane-associated protein